LPGCRTLLFSEGLLGSGLGCGSLFTLQSACRSGVQKFGDSPPGTEPRWSSGSGRNPAAIPSGP
jgi:hypothetical protein